MIRLLRWCCVFCLLLPALAAHAGQKETCIVKGDSRLCLDGTNFQLKAVAAEKELDLVKIICANRGKGPVWIQQIDPVAGGTNAFPDPIQVLYRFRQLLPGDTQQLTVRLWSRGTYGRFTRQFRCRTNVGDTVLTVTGVIRENKNGPLIQFDQDTFHAGKVPLNTIVTHTWHFKNTGRRPLVIDTVRADDGNPYFPEPKFRVVSYTREPVLPGGSGNITVRYNPMLRMALDGERLGPFRQRIDVWCNVISRRGVSEVFLEGERVRPPGALLLPLSNPVRELVIDERGQTTMPIKNIGAGLLVIRSLTSDKTRFSATLPDTPLAQGGYQNIPLQYLGAPEDRTVTDRLRIVTNAPGADSVTEITVDARLTIDLTRRPELFARYVSIAEEEHDFGTIPEGPTATCTFRICNKGKWPLQVRRVAPSCGCMAPEWPKEEILPGHCGEIQVVYSTTGRPGPFLKTLYLATNFGDTQLRIKGTVGPGTPAGKQ